MHDDFLKLLEAAKSLVTYIDKEYVFDKAAAGGCSGMDYHLSDTFYDLIVIPERRSAKLKMDWKGHLRTVTIRYRSKDA